VRNTMMKTARELYEAYENDVVSKRVKGQAELGTKFYHPTSDDADIRNPLQKSGRFLIDSLGGEDMTSASRALEIRFAD
jgi:hypothetical protein